MSTWAFSVDEEDFTLKADRHPDTDPAEIAEDAAEQFWKREPSDLSEGWPRDFKIFRDGVEVGAFSVDMNWYPSFYARQA